MDASTTSATVDSHDHDHDAETLEYKRVRLLASLTLIGGIGLILALPFALRAGAEFVGSSRVDLQACKLEYSIVSPK